MENFLNPFECLGIHRSATNAEILAGVAAAIRRAPDKMRLFAEAQALLLDPSKRSIADFLCHLLPGGHVEDGNIPPTIDLQWRWRNDD